MSAEMEDLARDAMRPITPDIIEKAERLERSIDRLGNIINGFAHGMEYYPEVTNNKEENDVDNEE